MNKKRDKIKHSKKISDFEIRTFGILLIIIILSSVLFLRSINSKPLLPSGESYYNLRISHEISNNLLLTKDPIQGDDYEPNPYHYFLALLLKIFSEQMIILFLPIILGILSVFIFVKNLILIKIDKKKAGYSMIIIAVSPIFITLFTGLYNLGFIIFLSMISYYLLNYKEKNNVKEKIFYVLGIIMMQILLMTSIISFMIVLIAIIMTKLLLKDNLKKLIIPFIISIFILIISKALNMIIYGINNNYFTNFSINNSLSILNASMGLDIFLLIIFFIGFVILWDKQHEVNLVHLTVILLIGISFFNFAIRGIITFIMSYYCVEAILFLYKRKWDLDIVRKGTLILVLCSLIFSGLNQINLLSEQPPTKQFHDALNKLRVFEKGRVLSSEENNFLIQYYSNKSTVTGVNIKNILFNTGWIKDAAPLLNKTRTKYILVTPSMKEDLWNDKIGGLLFLMTYSDHFKRIYNKKGFEIWGYLSN